MKIAAPDSLPEDRLISCFLKIFIHADRCRIMLNVWFSIRSKERRQQLHFWIDFTINLFEQIDYSIIIQAAFIIDL